MIIEVNPGDAGGVAELSARKQDSIQNAIGLFRLDGWTQAAEGEPYTQTIQIGQEVFPDGTSRDFLATYKYPSVIASPSEDSMGEIALAEAKITAFDSIEDALSYSVTASATEPPSTDVTFEFIIYGDNDTLGDLITDTTKAYIDNEVPALIDSMVSDAPITLVSAQNNEIGQFTLNQTGGQDLIIPSSFQAYENVQVTFVRQSSPDVADYPLCATYTVQGVTEYMYASVTFSDAQVGSNLFAPFCQTKENAVCLYAKEALTVFSQTIPTICVGLEDISAAQTESALLNGKVDKLSTSGSNYAYTHNGSVQGEMAVAEGVTNGSIMRRSTTTGRAQAADPDAGATNQTLATTNWVSQTGDSSPNNLIHKTGNESFTGTKSSNILQTFNSRPYLFQRVAASNRWFKVFSFTSNPAARRVLQLDVFWAHQSYNGYGAGRVILATIGGNTSAKWMYRNGNATAFTADTIFIGVNNTSTDIWIKGGYFVYVELSRMFRGNVEEAISAANVVYDESAGVDTIDTSVYTNYAYGSD